MPIVFSAIVPHSPLLVKTIGKENSDRLSMTLASYEKLKISLLSIKPDAIIIITPHGPIQAAAFAMNLNPDFHSDFKEFGDLATFGKYSGDIALAYKIKERLEATAKLQLISNPEIDYGVGIPLHLFGEKIKAKIIPLYISGLNLNEHYEFGGLLQRELISAKEKIAVIASSDLSHKLAKNSPAGFSPKAKKFDAKTIELLMNNKINDLISIDEKLLENAEACGIKPIALLLGILQNLKYETQLLSYEFPFGVGYMAMNFKF